MKKTKSIFWDNSILQHVALFLGLMISAVFGILITSTPTHAEAKQSTLTLTTTVGTLSLDVSPTSGGFSESPSATITATTDNFTGYTLSIATVNHTGNDSLLPSTSLTDGNGNEIESIGASVSESSFQSSTDYDNKWGYRPSQYVTTSGGNNTVVSNNTNFLPSPTTTGDILDITNAANASNTSNTYTLDFATKVNFDTEPGTYTTNLVILAVANNIVYNITYDKNTPDLQEAVSNMPTPNPAAVTIAGGTTASESITTLSSNIPTRTGYTFNGWCDTATTLDTTTNIQSCSGTTYQAGATYGIDQTADGSNIRLYAIWTPTVYTINLNANTGTLGSSTTTATYLSTTLSTITNPTKANTTSTRTVSGFTLPSGNNATGASVLYQSTGNCTAASNCKSTRTTTYAFNGWYKEAGTSGAGAGGLIATNSTTPVLQANTSYTDAYGKWTNTTTAASPGITLYAGWTGTAGSYASVTLPTITKDGYECGWTDTSTGATSIQYESGSALTPTANKTLYGVCIAIDYTVTIHAGNGVSSIALSGWTGTGTGTLTKVYHIGDTINLSSATLTYKTGYSGTNIVKNDNIGSLSDSVYTVGAGDGDITIHATTLATPVCTILGGTTKVYNRSITTLTATDNSESYDTSSVDLTYSFGFALGSSTVDGSTADLGSFSTPQTSNTYDVAKNAFKSAYGRFYGVTVVVTDKNDSSITATCTSGTGYGTTTAANRTRLILVNSRIDFDANGGTLDGTSPIYVIYQNVASYSGRTNSTARAIPGVIPPTGYDFTGWYTSAGVKVINNDADKTRVASVSGWTDSSKRWIRTSTTSSASASNTLYAQYEPQSYTVTLNANGGSGGSASTTATYDATTLATITNPTKANTTGTRTVSGFTLTSSGTGAEVTYQSTGNCTAANNCKSTNTTTYALSGWYKEAGATNKIATNSTTPVLQANTSYTDADGKWTSTSGQTLYAGWTATAGSYASVVLPTITRTGYTCGWTTNQSATTYTYDSGSSFTPSGNTTLYGVCEGNTYTATIYYQSDPALRGQTIATTTAQCTVSNTAGNCSPTIPDEVIGSVGTYNNSYVGVASAVNTMSSSTSITLTGDASFYAVYRSTVSLHKPATPTSTTDVTLYRNQWFSSESALSTTILSSSTTGKSNYSYTVGYTDDTGYALYGFAKTINSVTRQAVCAANGTTACSTIARLALSDFTEVWAFEYKAFTATYYYNNNTTTGSCTTAAVTSITKTANRYAYVKTSTQTSISNRNIAIPTEVSDSKGTCGQTYLNVGTATDSMASVTPNTSRGDDTYYARYSEPIANYYYTSNAYTNRTVYRNQRVTGTTASDVSAIVLATASTGTSNYGTAVGPGSSVWYGLATTSTTTRKYSSVSAAATANAVYDKLYTIYTFNVTFAKGTNTSAIGATSGLCRVNATGASTGNSSCTVTAPTITPAAGYSSNGWSTTKDDINAGIAEGDDITITTNAQKYYGNVKAYMQDLTPTTIATLLPNTGDTATVFDRRDEQAYTIAKLADGKYWMTENLNLAGGTALSADDTDVTSAYISSFTSSNNLTKTGDTIVLPASSTSGFNTNNYSYVYNSGGTTCGDNSPCYSYYSWDAATLGSGRGIRTDNTDAGQSICPKGWRLPTAKYKSTFDATIAAQSDFYGLATSYGMSTGVWDQSTSNFYTQAGPGTTPNFLLADNYDSGSFSNWGYGRYWSSTSYANYNNARYFYLETTYVDSSAYYYRSLGMSVRCLFNTRTISDVTYLQDVTPTIANNTPIGATANLKDSRDNRSYNISKLADGNIWLLDNLALDLTSSTVLNGMNEANTNASNTTLGYLKGTTVRDPNTDTNGKYATAGVANWTGSSSSCSAPLINTSSKDSVYSNDSLSSDAKTWKFGIYYNYCAASAGSYCYGNGTSAGTSSGDATEDICPVNWHMPSGGYNSGDYYTLYNTEGYNTDTAYRTALHLPLSGYFANGLANNQTGAGFIWSSSRPSSDQDMYYLYASSGYIGLSSYSGRINGYSVRCIVGQ